MSTFGEKILWVTDKIFGYPPKVTSKDINYVVESAQGIGLPIRVTLPGLLNEDQQNMLEKRLNGPRRVDKRFEISCERHEIYVKRI